MFNDHLSDEAARERIRQRVEEAEMYSLQKRLGYGDSVNARLLFVVVVVIIVVAAALLL